MPETFTVPVTQFLRPNGRSKEITTKLPIEVKPLYDDMVAHDFVFEIEMLTTGNVSTTISCLDYDLDIVLTPNGPQVQEGMVLMLERKLWLEDNPG